MSNSTHSDSELNNGSIRIYLRRVLAVFLIIAVFIVPQIIIRSSINEARIWSGWFTAVLPEDADVKVLIDQLLETGVENAVYASGTFVKYMAIPSLKEASLDDVDKLLLPGDPRRDTWISSIRSLFRSSDGREIVYLPEDRSIRAYEKLFENLPGNAGVLIVDRIESAGWPSVGFFLLFALLVSFISQRGWKDRIIGFAGSSIWIPYLLMAPRGAVAFGMLLFFVLQLPANRRGPRRIFATVLAVLVSLPLVAGFMFPGSTAISLIALAGTLFFFQFIPVSRTDASSEKSGRKSPESWKLQKPPRIRKIQMLRQSVFSRKREHDLFVPVSLTASLLQREIPGTSGSKAAGRYSSAGNIAPLDPVNVVMLLASVGLLFLVAMVFAIQTFIPISPDKLVSIKVPGPGEVLSESVTASALHELDNSHNAGSLPDISTMVASRAYQQGFFYGGDAGLPLPGDVVGITAYRNIDGILSAFEVPMVIFDDEWFKNTVSSFTASPLGKLLLSAGGVAPVSFVDSSNRSGVFSSQKVHATTFYIVLFLSILLTLFPTRERIASRGAYISLSLVRRRAQAA